MSRIKGEWSNNGNIKTYLNKEFVNYTSYSLSTIYKTKCSNIEEEIPTKLINLLINYGTDEPSLNKILCDVETRELNFGKIIHEIKKINTIFHSNLNNRIIKISKIFYEIILDKIFTIIDNNSSINSINWYLSKADFNGLPLANLINDAKNYIKENSHAFGSEKFFYYHRALNFHSWNIHREFNFNGYENELPPKSSEATQGNEFVSEIYLDKLIGHWGCHIHSD